MSNCIIPVLYGLDIAKLDIVLDWFYVGDNVLSYINVLLSELILL